jgi:hypothetical protein
MTSLAGVLPETAQAYNALDAFARSNGITFARNQTPRRF